jgi:carboxypeptidase Q
VPRKRGKIVLFNVPFTNYGQTVQYRGGGAVAAACWCARVDDSVGHPILAAHAAHRRMAHNDSVPKIPHAAITPEDADMIARMIERDSASR